MRVAGKVVEFLSEAIDSNRKLVPLPYSEGVSAQ